MQHNEITKCLICDSDTHTITDTQIKSTYHVCEGCGFIFKDESFRISYEEEKTVYLRHDNNMENEGYVNMFNVFIRDFIEELPITGNTLDFGCGPGPVLYQIMKNQGYKAHKYDPFYQKDESIFTKTFQLITSTEAVEHFFDPLKEFKTLSSLLDKRGYLVIMTQLREMNETDFLKWWYRRDQTHVAFYSLKTFDYIASLYQLKRIKTNNKNVVVFQKV